MEKERRKMSLERSEEEKTSDVWREVSYELTPEELERRIERGQQKTDKGDDE